ncbi:sensor histidine kinase [Rhodovulum sp. DZ06]|uniref:sensor histidine kinase n=1 Tax=Rhodovulum sp. DZ06 TaxID=3425126 RepID=UPI003D33BCE5
MSVLGLSTALSLRARALLGGIVWIIIAVGLSGYVLVSTFDEISERSFQETLAGRAEQLETLIRSGALDDGIGGGMLSGPLFARGRDVFWQIQTPTGQSLLSPSLEGAPIPADTAAERSLQGPIGDYRRQLRETRGARYVARLPSGLLIQVVARTVRTTTVAGTVGEWTIRVAEPRAALTRDQLEFRRSLFGALIGLGASLVLAGAAQTGMALRPLVAMRAAFLSYREGETHRIEGRYPSDIATLVDDLNDLLDRNEEMMVRARRQAADLAHALKTPAAVLRNDLASNPRNDIDAAVRRQRMEEAVTRVESLINRYTARARLAGAAGAGALCEVVHVLEDLGRVMRQIHRDAGLDLELELDETLRVRAEEEDVEELFGNLMDNAHKWAIGVVKVVARREGPVGVITVEDDGPGIPEQKRQKALAAGGRLDEAVPGTGLGLAICSDIVEAYGGSLTLETSELGGLKVIVRLPAPEPASTRRR